MKQHFIFLDGGIGTILQENGLRSGELPEKWNITHPDFIKELHKKYYLAGSNIIYTNTFGANRLKYGSEGCYSLENIIQSAVKLAKEARKEAEEQGTEGPHFIALDIGPCGKLLKPLGDLDFEDAVSLFAEIVRIGVLAGVDLIVIETMNDSYEAKAALLAAKENSDLPVFVTTVYDENAKLLTGADPCAMVALLEAMGADAIGMNCSLGPEQMKRILPQLLEYASVPIIVKPNAGLPHSIDGYTRYDVGADEFALLMAEMAKMGACILGGCCGTTPEHIYRMVDALKKIKPIPVKDKNISLISSYTHGVEIGKRPILIGERINPTGKSKFKQALKSNDISYILSEGLKQQELGVDALDVNVGLPEIDETEMMVNVVKALQEVTDLPLQIDTANPVTMEKALRIYNGKALINSVSGKKEVMKSVFPLVKNMEALL